MAIKKFYEQFVDYSGSNVPLEQMTTVNIVKEQYDDGLICEHCTNHDQIVLGYGTYRPKIMFIGLTPSPYDYDIGIPFSDKPGKKLFGMIEYLSRKIDLTNNVYFTNLIAHPNSNPTKQDVISCRDRLHLEIGIIMPRNIIVLGYKTANALILSERGPEFYKKKKTVIKINGVYYPIYVTHTLQDLFYRRDDVKEEVKEDLDYFITELYGK